MYIVIWREPETHPVSGMYDGMVLLKHRRVRRNASLVTNFIDSITEYQAKVNKKITNENKITFF